MLTEEQKKQCEKECHTYITAVKKSIKEKYLGQIPAEFMAQLRQLEDFYRTYLRCSLEFREEEVICCRNQGQAKEYFQVNQLFTLMMQISNNMDKLVKNFGISPLAASKIKGLPTPENNQENFLETL